MSDNGPIEFIPVHAPAVVEPRDASGGALPWLLEALDAGGVSLQDGDVLVVTSKIISLLEGRAVRLDDVVPSRHARRLAKLIGKEPRKLELILREGRVQFVLPMHCVSRIPGISRLVHRLSPRPEDMRRGYATTNRVALMTWKHGTYLDDAGIDNSNIAPEYAALLPEDPSGHAREIRNALEARYGVSLAVIITDTVSSIERYGSRDIAIGFSGLEPVALHLFDHDLYGIARAGGADTTVDSIAAAAGLVMGKKTKRTPAMIVRGSDVVRAGPDDISMEDIAIPPSARTRATWHTAWATVWFRVASVLTFTGRPRAR